MKTETRKQQNARIRNESIMRIVRANHLHTREEIENIPWIEETCQYCGCKNIASFKARALRAATELLASKDGK